MNEADAQCPECGCPEAPQILTVATVLLVEEGAMYVDDRGNAYVESFGPTDWTQAEVLDTDSDGARYMCRDCGMEGDPDEWLADEGEDDEEPESLDPLVRCESCGGSDLRPMGSLRARLWMRCEDCCWTSGDMDFSDGEPS